MHIRVKFVLHMIINLIKVNMEFKDDDEAIQVAKALREAGFPVKLMRVTEDVKSEDVKF
jgi:hypothetical protein